MGITFPVDYLPEVSINGFAFQRSLVSGYGGNKAIVPQVPPHL
ncbi:hypothetical protein [Nostoc sp. FACHB-892]|nr:hypothetical protein [Nostoc sp. FACHB-892]